MESEQMDSDCDRVNEAKVPLLTIRAWRLPEKAGFLMLPGRLTNRMASLFARTTHGGLISPRWVSKPGLMTGRVKVQAEVGERVGSEMMLGAVKVGTVTLTTEPREVRFGRREVLVKVMVGMETVVTLVMPVKDGRGEEVETFNDPVGKESFARGERIEISPREGVDGTEAETFPVGRLTVVRLIGPTVLTTTMVVSEVSLPTTVVVSR